MAGGWRNKLYYGDNLDVLHRYVKDETVDLIYLDPPFKSDQNYNVLFAEQDGTRAAAQIKAFEDTWRWDEAAASAFEGVVESGGRVAEAMLAFRTFLGPSDMLAYLSMMAPRLVELRRTLKATGSIYLHCDPTASHYLKMLMDAVFGPTHFENEVVWYYRGAGVSPKRWARRHDILLFYSKGNEWLFNADPVRDEYAPATRERFKHYIGNVRGDKDYGTQALNPKGKHPDDVWEISIVAPSAKERLSYPTQKPERLLERVILASSNEGDLVLDPFCGCGTTVAVAERLNRRWIGIDITHLAVTLMKHRLLTRFGPSVEERYEVVGEPVSLPDAEALAVEDPYQFQWWALGLVGARPAEQKKGADKGVDGRLYFHDDAYGATKQIIFSVKAGHTNAAHVRDLRGVLDREKAEIGVLISMQEPTGPMRKEAASSGFYSWRAPGEREDRRFPRIQILTIEDLLAGKGIDYPPSQHRTFKGATKAGVKDRYGKVQHESLFKGPGSN